MKLRRTVEELELSLTVDSYVRWLAWFNVDGERRKKAVDEAKKKAEQDAKTKGRGNRRR